MCSPPLDRRHSKASSPVLHWFPTKPSPVACGWFCDVIAFDPPCHTARARSLPLLWHRTRSSTTCARATTAPPGATSSTCACRVSRGREQRGVWLPPARACRAALERYEPASRASCAAEQLGCLKSPPTPGRRGSGQVLHRAGQLHPPLKLRPESRVHAGGAGRLARRTPAPTPSIPQTPCVVLGVRFATTCVCARRRGPPAAAAERWWSARRRCTWHGVSGLSTHPPTRLRRLHVDFEKDTFAHVV